MTAHRRPPRVLHVSQPVDAGVAVVVADLAEHQCSLGWEVHLACPPSGWLLGRLADTPVHLHAWAADRTPNLAVAREARSLAAIVRAVHPDVAHLHSAKAGLAGRLAIRGRVPTVFQPHAWSFHAADGPVQIASTAWERWAMRWTHLLIAVSRGELAEGLRLGIEAPRSEVVSNGVDVRYFTPGDRTEARERLGLGPRPLAVVLGRLARQKGQDLALAAWPRISALVPGAHLAIVGDGPERAALAAALPSGVSLHGAVADPRDWLAAADVVLLPSRWEGMALVPLEAMACARSVVGFDVAGVAESVGDAGATVPAGDVDALADAVAERLADAGLTEREGKRGRARAEELFDRAETLTRMSTATESLARTAGNAAAGA
jgi:glycosyltransferase involved in cell wall biosynthesis